ncbi:MAG TPA: NnrU family protein [Methyloceanibacter sp.]|jgi:hypothetical protein|nr:NnrU family protein [Methyloceanibacter sp.]
MAVLILGIIVFLGVHLLPTLSNLRETLIARMGENGYKGTPFLVAIKTWALAHLIANGDLASIILFGSFLAYVVFDRITLKRRPATGHVTLAETGPPPQRHHRRSRRVHPLRRVPGLAAPALDRHFAFAVNPGNRLANGVAKSSILRCKNPYIFCHGDRPFFGCLGWS